MSGWIAIFLVTNVIYWAIFITLAVRHRPGAAAVGLGVMHMLLAAALSVAPFRSFLDSDYPGFVLGVLRFQKRGATLPVALLLLWALASAMMATAPPGRVSAVDQPCGFAGVTTTVDAAVACANDNTVANNAANTNPIRFIPTSPCDETPAIDNSVARHVPDRHPASAIADQATYMRFPVE